MLLDITTLEGLILYTLYLLHRLRFFRWRDTRRIAALFQKTLTLAAAPPPSALAQASLRGAEENDNLAKTTTTDMQPRLENEPPENNTVVERKDQEDQENEKDNRAYEGATLTLSTTSINDRLPPEILLLVFEQLSYLRSKKSLIGCMLVCRSWCDLLGPKVWKSPRVLWSQHWSRFYPISVRSGAREEVEDDEDLDNLNPDFLPAEMQQELLSRRDKEVLACRQIHRLDRQELKAWLEWKNGKKNRRHKRKGDESPMRRPSAVRRILLPASDDNGSEDEDTEDGAGLDEGEGDGENGNDSEDERYNDDMAELQGQESDSEIESEYEDASDDETPLMKLISGFDYLQSLVSGPRAMVEQSSPSATSEFSVARAMTRIRRQASARRARRRLAEMRPLDGLPRSLPLQSCGRWIQVINLQQETSFPQKINPQSLIHHAPTAVEAMLPGAAAGLIGAPPPPRDQRRLSLGLPLQLQRQHLHLQQQRHQDRQQNNNPPQGFLASIFGAFTNRPQQQQGRGGMGRIANADEAGFEILDTGRLRSRRSFVTDKTLRTILEQCPGLCRLTISECYGITDAGLLLIKDAECVKRGTLVSLHMAGCYQITDQGLLNLVGNIDSGNDDISSVEKHSQLLPRFESLDLAGCYQISDQGLIPLLKQCGPRLSQLRISDCESVSCNSIVTTLAQHCPYIHWLDLARSGTGLTESCLIRLAERCVNLERLNLARPQPQEPRSQHEEAGHGANATAQDMEEEQQQQPQLTGEAQDTSEDSDKPKEEEEEDEPISDRSIAVLCESCPKLQLLDLSYIHTITNSAIESLSETAKSLVCLTIIGCPGITTRSLTYLARLRNMSGKLGCITMGDALGISEKDIEQIMKGTLSGWQKSLADEANLGDILGHGWDE
ncbi:hypothetical protein BGZ58_006867 [Dissophora ornata]|nr:hypothetical protein BGZ58_006867 [Dissophora ornata]